MRNLKIVASVLLVSVLGCSEDDGDVEDTDDDDDDEDVAFHVDVYDCESGPDWDILLTDTGIQPASFILDDGESVRFTNTGAEPHSLKSGLAGSTGAGGLFDSGLLEPGESYCLRFDETGTVAYHCAQHEQHTASITIEP